jgi:hypothetical protein
MKIVVITAVNLFHPLLSKAFLQSLQCIVDGMIRMESGLINAKSTWNILEEKLCNFISLY